MGQNQKVYKLKKREIDGQNELFFLREFHTGHDIKPCFTL